MMPELSNDLRQIKKLDSKQKVLLFSLFGALFVIGTILGIVFTRSSRIKPAPSRIKVTQPTPKVKPKANLALSPLSKTLNVGESVPISVMVTGEPIQAADVVLTYNPKYIRVSDIVVGKKFPELLQKSIKSGEVVVSASLNPNNPNPATGELFTFKVTAVSATSAATISFDKKQTIVAKSGDNILGSTNPASFVIQ